MYIKWGAASTMDLVCGIEVRNACTEFEKDLWKNSAIWTYLEPLSYL